jgi:predicted Rossmann fold nucleotide-binding protein DprA/Smf involved in DNA uptake
LLNRGGNGQELERLEELGIWVITRFDEAYPPRFTERLKSAAPLMLYGAGDARLLNRPGLAVVGSRNIDQRGFALTEFMETCAESKLVLLGGAWMDKTAMGAALSGRKRSRTACRQPGKRHPRSRRSNNLEGHLVLATPSPTQASTLEWRWPATS